MAVGQIVGTRQNNAATSATITISGSDASTGVLEVQQILHGTSATVVYEDANISVTIDNLNGAGISQGNSILLDGNNSDKLKVQNGGTGTADFAIYGREVQPK